jgi:multicomponent K+:H+ antiporter subunit E
MSRLLPSPLTSAVLFVAWLLLNGSASTGHLLLAALLAIAIPFAAAPVRGERARIRHPGAAMRLAMVVLWDIVVSNVEVARRILGPESRLKPAFVWVPLSIRDPHGIAALAGIITLTPGTLSSDLSEDQRHLLVHALHVDDAQALVASIKSRYEAPLMHIFESESR